MPRRQEKYSIELPVFKSEMINKKTGVIIIFLVAALLVWGIVSIAQLIFIKNKGSQIKAIVLKVSMDCDRYNKIEVAFENKVYSVNISRIDCLKRAYRAGQSVTLIKYKDNNTLVWPIAKYEWLPFVLLAILALAFYTNKDKLLKLRVKNQ
jgi:hypothetical protein